MSGVFDNLTLIVNFAFNIITQIWNLCMSTILVFAIGLFLLSLAVKVFKRII